MLKELSPTSDGWNGTFNGQPMQHQIIGFWWNMKVQQQKKGNNLEHILP